MTNQHGPFSTPAFIIKLYDMLDEQVNFVTILIRALPNFKQS